MASAAQIDLNPEAAAVMLRPEGQQVSGRKGKITLARRRFQNGSLRLRGKRTKIWTLRWREDFILPDGSTKRSERTTVIGTKAEFPTERLARRRAELILSQVNRFDYQPGRLATFDEFSTRWQSQIGPLRKPSATKVAASHLRFHLVPAFGRLRLDRITQEDVQAFVGKLSKTCSRHTIMNVLGTFFSVRKTARQWGYLTLDIKLSDLVISSNKPAKPGRFFTANEARGIITSADEPWKTIFALAAMTGLRPGEVLGLGIDDLDFEQRLIFVRQSAWCSQLLATKTKRSTATVPMPDPLADVLTSYLASWKPNEKRLLFSNRRGNPYSENKVVQKRLWPILDTLQIPRCGMHAFRHSHASLLISTGASPKVTQEQLRHSDSKITMDKYAHIIGSEQRAAVEKVAHLVWPNVANFGAKVVAVN